MKCQNSHHFDLLALVNVTIHLDRSTADSFDLLLTTLGMTQVTGTCKRTAISLAQPTWILKNSGHWSKTLTQLFEQLM